MGDWKVGEPCGDCGCTAFIASPAGTLHAHLADCPRVAVRDKLAEWAESLEFYASTHDGSPEMVQAVAVEMRSFLAIGGQ